MFLEPLLALTVPSSTTFSLALLPLLLGLFTGTVIVVVAGLVGLVCPAALVSHSARFQVPGAGMVMVAGPVGDVCIGGIQALEWLTGQSW